jgi:hypothetical protein
MMWKYMFGVLGNHVYYLTCFILGGFIPSGLKTYFACAQNKKQSSHLLSLVSYRPLWIKMASVNIQILIIHCL